MAESFLEIGFGKKKRKGFVLTLEATISILAFAILIMALPHQAPQSLKELAALEQANDLLRVWGATNTTESEMISDTNWVFSTKAELWVNQRQLLKTNANEGSETASTEGIIVDNWLNEIKIRVAVHYD